jgi:hypothetical protein
MSVIYTAIKFPINILNYANYISDIWLDATYAQSYENYAGNFSNIVLC